MQERFMVYGTRSPINWIQKLRTNRLRKNFFVEVESARWRRLAAKQYLKQVNAFLEPLLLIAYIVSGQPVYGSELISREWHAWLGLALFPDNPLPEFGRGFNVVRAKPATTWMDTPAGHTTDTAERIYARIGSSGLSSKRKAVSDISGNQPGKKAKFRVEDRADKADGVIRGFLKLEDQESRMCRSRKAKLG
ncbi:uncharacterized protein K444DRAFT_638292 [Hyaloscypha bicolor E]|uniref:Uncharacterized protein n=1 Tax=Hyaloscypha bicolor E TaxID=1095630 RepID=A0A2J6SFX2_9HELO|nr:uncharacterized protein K444DRAFT_638292 [Hyaloscypha bicolor E]PMD49656.1 hypothetical protein K444DRAFT_638292 [Hyaloscypha bicolor E]